ncbi:MAG: xanthine dehydrogenase family protein molybdopterin-binding subunit [Burkholderiales bacterium]
MPEQSGRNAGVERTGIGAPVLRVEDKRFLTGKGRFVDDITMPGMVFAHVVRSSHAHARIVGIDTGDALAAPGVLLVLTGSDVVRESIGALPCEAFPGLPAGSPFHRPLQPILAIAKVRHVGEGVALVVALTAAQAKDAGERVVVDYAPIAAITLVDALDLDAPNVWDDAKTNLCFQIERGDRGAVDRAFMVAAHVTRLDVHYPRASANPIEPRGALAWRDPIDGRHTLCTSTQFPFQAREVLTGLFAISEASLRVIAPDVGGAFGMKSQIYPEEALVLWAAMTLQRPVKWIAERSESLAADMHGRHQITHAEVAFDAHARMLALRVSVAIDLGAYLGYSAGVAPNNAAISYTNTYDLPLIHADVKAAFTNTSVVGPYRGTAKPEATFVIERLLDTAARELGIDPIELRRRNLIPASAMPYRTPGGYLFDSGNFEDVLAKALTLADWAGFPARRARSQARGRERGRGLAMHCQRAGSQSERMEIRVAQDGTIALHVGTLATGQGHETMFAQMISEWLSVPFGHIHVFQGDTDKVLYGRGTFAQRSMNAGGSALKLAADEVVRKGKRIAAWMLETSEADIEFEHGEFRVNGTDRAVSFQAVVKKAYTPVGLPAEFGVGLDAVGVHRGPNNFPNGCMICEVEVDVETGGVTVDRLSAVDDVGAVINPVTLEGQLHGSIAQGLGPALFEELVYDRPTGQLVTGTFLDYGMPRADDLPHIASGVALVPTSTNLLGVKGGSEAGNVGAPPAILNAIVDALAPLGVTDVPMPATPERIWRAINAAATIPPQP